MDRPGSLRFSHAARHHQPDVPGHRLDPLPVGSPAQPVPALLHFRFHRSRGQLPRPDRRSHAGCHFSRPVEHGIRQPIIYPAADRCQLAAALFHLHLLPQRAIPAAPAPDASSPHSTWPFPLEEPLAGFLSAWLRQTYSKTFGNIPLGLFSAR